MSLLMSYIAEGEHKYQEFKESYSKSILKTVSAYANNHDGRIIIGVSDQGSIVGIRNSKEVRLNIENTINDSIRPRPYYEVYTMHEGNRDVLVFEVFKGTRTPYTYNYKAFERRDTSTVEVDRDRYDELVLRGKNLSFEELPYDNTKVRFTMLEQLLIGNLDIAALDLNNLKSLGLYKNGSYNIAAGLLADYNDFERIGMDIIRYSDATMQLVDDRVSHSGVSILSHFETCMTFFDRYIKQKDIIQSEKRITFTEVPKTAYREAVINAIIHRDYSKSANNRIEFFPDRIEILSVGGLPIGTSKEEYIKGSYSNLRNRILADIFFRIGYVEKMGTGIRRIKQSYVEYGVQPKLEVMPHSIRVVLPMIDTDEALGSPQKVRTVTQKLSTEEAKLYNYLGSVPSANRLEVGTYMQVGKTKTTKLLNALLFKGLIQKVGSGKQVRYKL